MRMIRGCCWAWYWCWFRFDPSTSRHTSWWCCLFGRTWKCILTLVSFLTFSLISVPGLDIRRPLHRPLLTDHTTRTSNWKNYINEKKYMKNTSNSNEDDIFNFYNTPCKTCDMDFLMSFWRQFGRKWGQIRWKSYHFLRKCHGNSMTWTCPKSTSCSSMDK